MIKLAQYLDWVYLLILLLGWVNKSPDWKTFLKRLHSNYQKGGLR